MQTARCVDLDDSWFSGQEPHLTNPRSFHIRIHPHAVARLNERGATEAEVISTIRSGESFAARLGRGGFRRNFQFDGFWRGKRYATKQVEVIAVKEADTWIVITVLVRYF